MQAFGDDQQVGVDGCAVLQHDGDMVAVVGDVGDLCVEPVVGPLGAVLDENARQLAAQDLQLGRRAVGLPRRRNGKRCRRRSVRLDEAGADLPGVGCADIVVDSHPADDLTGGTADVDVLALVATLGEALDNGRLPAAGGELMGQRGSGDARARDDGMKCHSAG